MSQHEYLWNNIKYKGIFEYEATFDPPVDSEAMRFKLLNQLQEAIGTFQTGDGLTIFLPTQFEKKVELFLLYLTVLFFL